MFNGKGSRGRFADSTEAANHQIVPVGAVKTQHVHNGFALRGINDLANTQQRLAARNGEKFGDARVGGGGVHFFVRVTELDIVIALQNAKERFTGDGGVEQAGKFRSAEITSFQRERLTGSVAEPFESDDATGGGKGKTRGGFVFVVHNFGEKNLGAGGEGAGGHLLRVAHQFVEVDFR